MGESSGRSKYVDAPRYWKDKITRQDHDLRCLSEAVQSRFLNPYHHLSPLSDRGHGFPDQRCANKCVDVVYHCVICVLNTTVPEFLDAIRSVNPPGRWKILVVDEHSQQLLGSVLKQFDILEENVTCTSPCVSTQIAAEQFTSFA